jgi:hypothetical protein
VIRIALSALFSAAIATVAAAASLSLSQHERWLVVASTKDVDTAIGIAGLYETEKPRVVAARNGWLAVVIGPYKARSLNDLIERTDRLPALPHDAMLSRGRGYVDTVWLQVAPQGPMQVTYGPAKSAQITADALEVSVNMLVGTGENQSGPTTLTGKVAGQTAFSFTFGDPSDSTKAATATVAWLDKSADYPQVIVTRYTSGAHCCTKTWIATKPKTSADWVLLEVSELDGDGYRLRDLDNDGVFELAAPDNAFLYAFDSYANSYAPTVYTRLSGMEIVDASNAPAASHALRQDLAAMEFNARIDPSNWNRSGFLAAWVAAKMRLGEGDDAWSTMLENFDRDASYAIDECGGADCPVTAQTALTFPEALSKFLEQAGYGSLPALAPHVAN